MTEAELLAALEDTGYPVAYHHWKSAQDPPYIVYFATSTEDIKADDANYAPVGNYAVEFYSTERDAAAEAAIEAVLPGPWTKETDYLSDEEMHFTLWNIQLI